MVTVAVDNDTDPDVDVIVAVSVSVDVDADVVYSVAVHDDAAIVVAVCEVAKLRGCETVILPDYETARL